MLSITEEYQFSINAELKQFSSSFSRYFGNEILRNYGYGNVSNVTRPRNEDASAINISINTWYSDARVTDAGELSCGGRDV